MKKEIGGKTYVQVPELVFRRCTGCVARSDDGSIGTLCYALGDECSVNRTIWKEQTMSNEKTALELVDELIGMMGCPPPGQLIKLKSAIERERAKDTEEYSALMNISAYRACIISDLTEQLKSAITMRPIAELPDKVPDGCVIVAIRVDNTDVFVWRHCSDIKDIVAKNPFAGFYIIPLPKPDRRLHPCYMPGCGGDGKCVYDYSGSEDRSRKSWFVDCLKCHAQGPRCDSEQEAEQAWGYAE